MDVSALREHAHFRRLFAAQLLSQIGTEITFVALLTQVYSITGSSLQTGLLGLARFGPTMVFSLLGGAIADATDRRHLLIGVQLLMLGVSGGLALVSATMTPPVWLLFVLAALGSTFAAVDGPARTAVIPALVDESTLRSAIQLREVLTQSGRLFGPVLGGLLVAHAGYAAAYAIDAATFLLAFVLFLGLPSLVPQQRRRFELSSISEGLRFVGARPVVASIFYADIVAMVLGMPRAIFPAMAAEMYGASDQEVPALVGLMLAAIAAGAIAGLLLGGLYRSIHREGLAVLVSVAVWGAAMAAFGVTPWLWLGLVFLAVGGWADMVSALFRQTMLIESVPDELRGRLSAVHIMVVTGGPPLGDFRAGASADAVGLRPSIVVGGLACVAGMAWLAWRVPGFRRYERPSPPSQ